MPKTGNELGKKVTKVLNKPNLSQSIDENNMQPGPSRLPGEKETSTPKPESKKRRKVTKKKKSKKSKRPIPSSEDSTTSNSDSEEASEATFSSSTSYDS